MVDDAQLPKMLKHTLISLVRRDEPDLSARQLGALLICCLEGDTHSVAEIAMRLQISSPGAARAIDRLSILGLIVRMREPAHPRFVRLQASSSGRHFVAGLERLMVDAEK